MSGRLPGRSAATIAILFCGMVAFLDGADTQSLAIAAPVMARELGIEPGRLGIIFSIGVLGGVLGAMTCGPLADRVGPKRILALSTLWFGVFQLATSFASGFSSLLLLRAFAGFGLGAAAPCFLALAAAHTTSDRRSTVLSMLWACFPFGALVGGVVNGWIVQHLGWRVVFVTGGVLPIVLAFVLLAVVAEAPRTRTPSPSAGSGGSDWHAPTWWTDPYLRERLLLLWCILFGAFGALAGIVVWMPTILVKAGLSPSLGGLVLSWHAVGALISMASAGYLTKRFGARVLAGGLFLGAVALIGTALVLPSFVWTATGMVVLGVLFGVAASGAIATAGALLPSEARSSGLGWSMGIGRLGQVLLPFLMGLGLERASPSAVLAALAVAPALLAIAAIRFAAIGRRPQSITMKNRG
jgi:AAHS family 4-hydroxybenzoate transporter-like MFS transporter